MNLHFVISIMILVVANAKPTPSAVSVLANQMNAEMPGSVDEFVAWGREEALMEHYFAVLTGSVPVPGNFRPFSPGELRYLTTYLRPSTPIHEHLAILRNAVTFGLVFCPGTPEDEIAKQDRLLETLSTFPEYIFFTIYHLLNGLRQSNTPIDYSRIAVMFAPEGSRLSFESRLRVWNQICFSDPQLRECYRDGTIWRLRETGHMQMMRQFAWSAVSRRAMNSRRNP